MLLLLFFRNSVWSKQLYISRVGCKQEAQKLIITHVNYGLNDEIFWEQMCVKYDQHHLYSLRLLAVIFDHCHLIARHPMLTTSSFTWNSKKKTKTVLWLFWKRSLQGELLSGLLNYTLKLTKIRIIKNFRRLHKLYYSLCRV